MFVFQGIFHDQESLFNRKRLFNEIKRSQPSGFYCGLDSAMSGNQHGAANELRIGYGKSGETLLETQSAFFPPGIILSGRNLYDKASAGGDIIFDVDITLMVGHNPADNSQTQPGPLLAS